MPRLHMQSSTFQAMVMLQLQVLVLMAAGYALAKTGVITPQGRKSMADLLISFFLPCSIVCSFQMELTAQIVVSCASILLLAVLAQAVYWLAGRLLFRGEAAGRLSCLRYATLCSNAGFLGLPIIGGVYGEMGTLLTSVALIPQRIVMWSAGLSLFTHTDGKSVLRKVLTPPCIVAVFIGFGLMVSGNPALPGFVQKSLSAAGGCTTCVSMLVIGAILAEAGRVNLRDKTLVRYTFVRLLLIPLAMFLLLTLAGTDALVLGVMVLMSGMPAGSTTAILASKYGGDAAFASCMVFVSTLASIVTLPLICLLL